MARKDVTYQDIASAFNQGKFEPVYFVYGEEQFVAGELQRLLVEKALQPGERDFNLDQVHGPDSDVKAVLALCGSYPVMGARRLIIVTEFEKLHKNERFVEYAKHPNPSSIVFLRCNGKPNLNTNPYRALRRHGLPVVCETPAEKHLPAWVRRRVGFFGKKIDPKAAQLLVQTTMRSLGLLATEIDKLISYIGDRNTITEEDVLTGAGHSEQYNVFSLQRAIGRRDYPQALETAERLLQQQSNRKGEIFMLIAMLTTFFTRLWKLSECRSQGRTRIQEVARDAGIAPYFVGDFVEYIQYYTPSTIDHAFSALLAADYELKGGSTRDERLIITLMLRRMIL